jgi:cytochrome c oxidase cbb3-type subunit IV
MDYETLRQMADSWGLLYLFIVFIGVIIFTFRPGTKKQAADIAQIPFREDKDDVR